jgi:hypothetical protein
VLGETELIQRERESRVGSQERRTREADERAVAAHDEREKETTGEPIRRGSKWEVRRKLKYTSVAAGRPTHAGVTPA